MQKWQKNFKRKKNKRHHHLLQDLFKFTKKKIEREKIKVDFTQKKMLQIKNLMKNRRKNVSRDNKRQIAG